MHMNWLFLCVHLYPIVVLCADALYLGFRSLGLWQCHSTQAGLSLALGLGCVEFPVEQVADREVPETDINSIIWVCGFNKFICLEWMDRLVWRVTLHCVPIYIICCSMITCMSSWPHCKVDNPVYLELLSIRGCTCCMVQFTCVRLILRCFRSFGSVPSIS